MAEENQAPERVPSRHELYLDSLAEANADGNEAEVPEDVKEKDAPAPYAVEDQDTSGFVGVSPEYRTYSGVFRQPFQAEEGPTVDAEQEASERVLVLQHPSHTPHPSTSLGTAGPREAGTASVPAEDSAVEDSDENTESGDTPQLPPVPASTRKRGSHSAASSSDDDDDDNE